MKHLEESEQLYFIAIIPPEPIYTEALTFRNYFKDNYNSKAALNSPPHITLHMPFKWKEIKTDKLCDRLRAFASNQISFELHLKNFGSFKPRVIFMDVVSNDRLSSMQKELVKFCKTEFNLFNANHQDQPFHPHLTLAFRDLRKSMFLKAWSEFENKSFEARWKVNGFVLLKHDGKKWNLFREFDF